VTDYRIKAYLRSTNTVVAQKDVVVGSGSRSSTITGLTQGTSYDMVVEALNGSTVISVSARVGFATTMPIQYVSANITSFTNVRTRAAIVNWSFTGDVSAIEKFSVRRNDTADTWLSSLIPTGQATFSQEIARGADSQWWLIVRAHYKDGTTRDSAPKQLPKSGSSTFSTIASVTAVSAPIGALPSNAFDEATIETSGRESTVSLIVASTPPSLTPSRALTSVFSNEFEDLLASSSSSSSLEEAIDLIAHDVDVLNRIL